VPFIRITVLGPTLSAQQVKQLQDRTTDLMASVLRKKSELTSVLIDQPTTAGWAIGRAPATLAAHIDAKITSGTNTPEEKARFILEATRLLKDVLGDTLPIATYVVVHDVAADSWGYDGVTQESRRQNAASR
jgi:4-oxalocrotonate tautomerase